MNIGKVLSAGLIVWILAGVLVLDGCKSSKPKRREMTLSGVAESIDVDRGIVTMNFFSKKRGKMVPLDGRIVPETEIYIDGRLSELNQIKQGDEIIAQGYKEGPAIVVLRIEVIRSGSEQIAVPALLPASTRPATSTMGAGSADN